MARNDLELAKSVMTPEQLQQWSELRSRSEVRVLIFQLLNIDFTLKIWSYQFHHEIYSHIGQFVRSKNSPFWQNGQTDRNTVKTPIKGPLFKRHLLKNPRMVPINP